MEKKQERSRDSDPDVIIMGESVSSLKKQHRHDTGSVIWGLLLIFAGILFFLNSFNIVPWTVWDVLIRFWPLLLVLGGLHIILGNSVISRLVLTILTFCVFALAALIALESVAPDLIQNLPPQAKTIINTWKEFRT